MTHLLRKNSQIPAYMAYPRFLLTMDISETAKLVYVLLLDRARLSMKNDGWENSLNPAACVPARQQLMNSGSRNESTGSFWTRWQGIAAWDCLTRNCGSTPLKMILDTTPNK